MKKYLLHFFFSFVVLLAAIPALAAGPIHERASSSYYNPYSTSFTSSQNDEIEQDMQQLERLYRYVDSMYLNDIDRNAAYEAMAKALLASLEDEYSFYIGADEASDYMDDTTGVYGGIGTYISKPHPDSRDSSNPDALYITIVSPFPGSPAERAGLRSGDLITHIDGKDVDDLSVAQASSSLKGTPGTPVTLTVKRGGNPFEVSLIREQVTTPSTTHGIIDGNIGYVQISQFVTSTAKDVEKILKDFQSKKVAGIVIDLRNNHGGLVDSALTIADFFLPDGKTIVNLNHKNKSDDIRYIASDGTLIPQNVPLALLINEGSASSSEILAGALKDNGRAILVGETSFGKGVMQSVTTFGNGYLQVTNARYLTPSGADIHKKGIEPDIRVEEPSFTEEEVLSYEKLMADRAIYVFVDAHPDYTEENLQTFAQENAESGVRKELLILLVRNEYLARIPYADRPIADLKHDVTLLKAIEYIHSGQ
ncbi:S41 family peptidase [Parasphaerochaeta coccoides]|uniref:Carboxyl-terminal protease n=1 Tax=Parasphaerochaeta coccoides (strain ATCC BAA-1237 / DSM 17374 / SPN1) TaxID=760011 RepID=F4GLZ2_PARC1|nr:S41 family peptidase [Parasphaerochaeta coccoides]AEC03033.1 carboxyl-terminal protease [Parasphaerochaeta coccoides DSM 17374]